MTNENKTEHEKKKMELNKPNVNGIVKFRYDCVLDAPRTKLNFNIKYIFSQMVEHRI